MFLSTTGGSVRKSFKALIADDNGATAVEYGLILALIFLAMAGAVAGVGTETGVMWNKVATEVESANTKGS